MKKIIYGIESSFDDFSIALLNENLKLEKMITYNVSAMMWEKYGGVVPVLAAKEGFVALEKAFNEIDVYLKSDYSNIEFIAFTLKPGLKSCLKIGEELAKKISLKFNIPLIGVDHLEGHFFANFIDNENQIPFRSLYFIFSGGNSKGFLVEKKNHKFSFEEICKTRDIALGDMLDKLARELNFKNAIEMDILKEKVDYNFKLTKIRFQYGNRDDFSFSGWETCLKAFIKMNNLYTRFQKAFIIFDSVFNAISDKIKKIALKYNSVLIVSGGGVMSNDLFREILEKTKLKFIFGEKKFNTDNAAMIAAASLLSENSIFYD